MKIGNIIYYITKYTGIKYLVDKYHKFRGTKVMDKRTKHNLE